MPKIKDMMPSIFGGSKDAKAAGRNSKDDGRLESDALPVNDLNNDANANVTSSTTSLAESTTVSTDLTASAVRELSDPNYNSSQMQVMPSFSTTPTTRNSEPVALYEATGGGMALPTTSNTMNVHNAQQQVIMQFSNASNLHFGSVYNINGNLSANSSRKSSTIDMDAVGAACSGGSGTASTGPEPTSKRQTPLKTTSIVKMMQSQEEPSPRMLDTIATHLGEGWKKIMRDLGLSEGEIEQAIIDHQMHGGIKEVIYQLLLKWLQNADDGVGTLGRVTTLLWECHHRECVQRMKLTYKSELNRSKPPS